MEEIKTQAPVREIFIEITRELKIRKRYIIDLSRRIKNVENEPTN